MNALNESWSSALSMTLLHSLWQGLAITLATWVLLRMFTLRASIKYLITTTSIFIFFIVAIATFLSLSQPYLAGTATHVFSAPSVQLSTERVSVNVYTEVITHFLQVNQHWIVMGWAIGVLLFSLRFASGVAYLNYLRFQSTPVNSYWNEMLKNLSSKLGIQRAVTLFESAAVQTPIVIGYIKPVVLMPIGLLTGLSTQQVEVILIHELAHIKRQDYLINFIQSLGETVFFFNPFVWILSAWIREERENCCDDSVLAQGCDPHVYASTLVELESARVDSGSLALALTGNKNQLFNRIKRIMERPAKNQNGKEKFIPIIVVVLGLVLASWISINPKEEQEVNQETAMEEVLEPDTAKKPTQSSTYSRKSIITYDENGKPHEEVVENYDGDEEIRGVISDLDIPEVPEFPAMPDFDFDVQMSPPSPMELEWDTLPGRSFEFDETRLQEFQKQFEAEFKEKFGDFYAENQKEMEQMMKQVQERMSHLDVKWQYDLQGRLHEMEANLAPLAELSEKSLHEAEARLHDAEAMMRLSEHDMHNAEASQRESEAQVKVIEARTKAFESEIATELVKDGYLNSNEKIKDIHYTESGEIKVNNKPIKEVHKKKYNELHKKYFDHNDRHHRPE